MLNVKHGSTLTPLPVMPNVSASEKSAAGGPLGRMAGIPDERILEMGSAD
jgi:hypothetical protein